MTGQGTASGRGRCGQKSSPVGLATGCFGSFGAMGDQFCPATAVVRSAGLRCRVGSAYGDDDADLRRRTSWPTTARRSAEKGVPGAMLAVVIVPGPLDRKGTCGAGRML
jgi:hypothetical protein